MKFLTTDKLQTDINNSNHCLKRASHLIKKCIYMQDGMFAVKSNNKMSSFYKWDRRQKHLQWVYTQIIPPCFPCFIMTIGNTCRKHFFLPHKPRRIKQETSSLTVKQSQNRKMIQCAYSL